MMQKIENRSAQICVLGLGYVGLPMCIEFVRAGFHVTGIDNDVERVNHLKHGHSYILDISDEELSAIRENFTPTTNFGALRHADATIICVPTPLRKTKDPDLSYILAATVQIAKHLQRGQLIILESTTYPGTTDEIILQELEKNGLHAGTDFYLAFSPERIDPGNKKFTLRNTPKIVGGVSKRCGELAEALL